MQPYTKVPECFSKDMPDATCLSDTVVLFSHLLSAMSTLSMLFSLTNMLDIFSWEYNINDHALTDCR